uniref:Uncharacterized protein n=1 Tax=Oryza rufipogon TaxID=4529 RepID=A0A0E0PXG8_ORYRU
MTIPIPTPVVYPEMAGSASSPYVAPLISSRITGRLRPASARTDPLGLAAAAAAVRVRSWRRFAGARCEVALLPARRISAQPRRRNALREKASPPPPADPQVLEESGSLDVQRLPDLDREPGISGGLDAVTSGNIVSKWNLEGGSDVVGLGVAQTGPGIVGRGGNTEVQGRGGNVEEVMISRAGAMANQFGSGECEVPTLSSSFPFLTVEAKEPLVVDAQFLAVQIDKPRLRSIAWSGFAALCAACVLLAVSKLIWGNGKKYLSRNMFDILRPRMNKGESGKGGIKVLKNVKCPEDLLGRPQLDRHKLMNNIKRAKQSRELFDLSSVFGYCSVATCYDVIITETRRMVTNVHTLLEGILEQSKTKSKHSVLFPHPAATNGQEVSASHGQCSVYLNDVLGCAELPDISISNNIIGETVESSVDFKSSAQVMDNSVKNQNNVGDIEPPVDTPTNDMPTDAKDSIPMVHVVEIEEQIGSPDECIDGLNSISIPSSEFEGQKQFPDISVKNVDGIFGIKSSQISSDTDVIGTNDNSHKFSINVASKTTGDLSSGCSNSIPSESESKEIPVDINRNDLNYFQEIEAQSTFANYDAQTVQYEEISHRVSMITKEACINPAMADILITKSSQRIGEEPVDLMRGNAQSMQELEPSSSIRDHKQIVLANQKNNIISRSHNETQASSEIDSIGTNDNASTSSVYDLPEESIHQSAKNSTENTSYNEEPEESIIKRKIKLHQEMCNDKDAQTKHKVEGVSEIGPEFGPSNDVCKTETVAKKRSKKTPCDKGLKVPEQDIVQCNSMADKKSSSKNVKRTRKNLKSALRNQGTQTTQEISETALVVNSPDDAPRAENIRPFGGSGSSTETQSPMFSDTFSEARPNGFSISTMRKEKSKHNFQPLESVEAAAVKFKTNRHGDNIMNERAIDFDISNLGVTTTKKMTKRRSLSKRKKPANGLGGATDVPPDV